MSDLCLKALRPLGSYASDLLSSSLPEMLNPTTRGLNQQPCGFFFLSSRQTIVEGHREADRYLNASPTYKANPTPQPGANRVPTGRPGPLRYDLPPSSSPGQQGAPSYEAAIKASSRAAAPNQYGKYEDGQYPNHRTKNPAIGAV
ncbi:par-3 family cell polarity regulator beta a isoform X1 [Tachysurus ichikawai]